MDTISREDLKKKLDGQEDLKLVMVLGERAFHTMHIPGSVHLDNLDEALETLDPDDDIVLYDSGPHCPASRIACRVLKARGYERVRRYAGGLEDWEEAGYPLKGEFFGIDISAEMVKEVKKSKGFLQAAAGRDVQGSPHKAEHPGLMTERAGLDINSNQLRSSERR
jgi:rhodanese-related sulfurtransferase